MKQAKSRAAQNLIDKIEGRVPRWYMNELKPPVSRSCITAYVCVLHNFCVQREVAIPRYFTPLAPGANGQTATICRCGSFTATGYGSSRKRARGAAAKGVISQLEACFGVSIP